jgi:hypothetical protein
VSLARRPRYAQPMRRWDSKNQMRDQELLAMGFSTGVHSRLANLCQFAVLGCKFTSAVYVMKKGNAYYVNPVNHNMTPDLSASNYLFLKAPLHPISSHPLHFNFQFPLTPTTPQSSPPSKMCTMPCNASITATNPPLSTFHCSSTSFNSLILRFSNPPCSAKSLLVSNSPSKQFFA